MKDKKWRLRYNMYIFLLIIIVLSGCNREEPQEITEITLMHGWGGSLATHEMMQSIFDEFMSQNPDIKLVCQALPDSSVVLEKANEMLAVNKMPDIISTNGNADYVGNAVKKGKALDLMPYILKNEALQKSIYHTVFDTWTTEEGQIYTLPDAMEASGYWYNEEIFIRAGVAKPPETWEEFWETCEKVKNLQDVYPMAMEKIQAVEYFLPARIAGISLEGLSFVESMPERFDRECFYSGMEDVRRAYSYSMPVNSLNDAREAFRNGKIAFYFNGVWECEELKEMKGVRYADYPTETGQSLAYLSASSGYVVCNSKDEKKVAACIRFLEYILSDQVQTKIAIETGQAPSNPQVNPDTIQEGYPLLGESLSVVRKADIQIKSIYSVWNGQVVEQIKEGLSGINNESLTVQELAERLNEK